MTTPTPEGAAQTACPHCQDGTVLVDASRWYRCGPGAFDYDLEVAQDEMPCPECNGTGVRTLADRARQLIAQDRAWQSRAARPAA